MDQVRCRPLVSSDSIEFVQCASFVGKDVGGGFVPSKRLLLCVALSEVIVDSGFRTADASVTATADAVCGDRDKEAFDNVQRWRAIRVEMQRIV